MSAEIQPKKPKIEPHFLPEQPNFKKIGLGVYVLGLNDLREEFSVAVIMPVYWYIFIAIFSNIPTCFAQYKTLCYRCYSLTHRV